MHFWLFSAWNWARLAPIYSKQHLKHDNTLFSRPLALCIMIFLLGHVQKSLEKERKTVAYCTSLGFLGFLNFFGGVSFFSFSDLSVPVIDILLGLLSVEKFLRKYLCHRQFLPWSSQV